MLADILENCYQVVLEAAPYILLGTFFAGLIQAFLRADSLKRLLSQPSFKSVYRAALIGVPLPLCSCSVLPVAMQLRRSGANRGATSSFLISTPETGVDSVLLTIGLMNPIFAAARIIGAFVTSLFAGTVQNLLDRRGDLGTAPVVEEQAEKKTGGCCSSSSCGAAAQDPPAGERRTWKRRLLSGQSYAFTDLLPSLGKYYVIGILATGILMALLPEGILENYLGGGLAGMLAVSVVGVFIYICASGATPFVAALIAKGMSPGTALVLLLAGPATSMASLVAVRAMLGTRGLAVYLFSIMICAIGLGLALDYFYVATGIPMIVRQAQETQSGVSPFLHVIAIATILYLAWWMARPWMKWLAGRRPLQAALRLFH